MKRELTDAYRLAADDAAAALDTDLRRGLAGAEAAARLDTIGRNELAVEARVSASSRFLSQFRDVLVILLLVATAVSVALWFVERDTAQASALQVARRPESGYHGTHDYPTYGARRHSPLP